MLGILRRAFSFSDWTQHHPREPPPGDMLDASFDAQNQRIFELEATVSRLLRSDGALRNEIVSFDSFQPEVLGFFEQKLEEMTKEVVRRVLDLYESTETAQKRAVLAEIEAKSASSVALVAGDRALAAKNTAFIQLQLLNVRLDETEQLLEKAAETRTDFDDAAAEAEAWALSSALWAEHMPDTLPDNAVKIMDITGDHWSSRWWAHQARLIGDEIRDVMLNPQRAGMLTLWYRAVAGQTVFPLTTPALDGRTFVLDDEYPEQLDVSVNGIRIMPKPVSAADGDWVVDETTSVVTLLRPLRAGDMVSIDVLVPVEKLSPGTVKAWSLVPLTGMNGVLNVFPLWAKDGSKVVDVQRTEELLVSLDGVVQEPISSYTAAGAVITFTTAPGADSRIFITWFETAGGGGVVVPAEDEVTGGHITIGSVAPASPSVNDVWIDTA